MAEEVKDISLSSKKSFRIDGDNNRIIYLDTSDMNILVRFEEVYPEIRKLAVDAAERAEATKQAPPEEPGEDIEDDGPIFGETTAILKEIDSKMREKLNYIFASDIADICEPTGNMYDMVNGEFRFEHIISVLSNLYINNINSEIRKMQERVKKHTAKYTNRRRK